MWERRWTGSYLSLSCFQCLNEVLLSLWLLSWYLWLELDTATWDFLRQVCYWKCYPCLPIQRLTHTLVHTQKKCQSSINEDSTARQHITSCAKLDFWTYCVLILLRGVVGKAHNKRVIRRCVRTEWQICFIIFLTYDFISGHDDEPNTMMNCQMFIGIANVSFSVVFVTNF